MLSLPPSVRIFIAMQPVDGRKGADGLVALIRSADHLVIAAFSLRAVPPSR
jgi:hypothetical protein